jgi:hypothetical protein
MEITQGDYGFDLNFTLTGSDGTALNLTGATSVKFKMALIGTNTNKVNAECTVDVAASGTCHYTMVSGDTDTIGDYNWEIQVTYATKLVTAKMGETISIVSQLAE